MPSNRILRFERDDGLLAFLWLVRGLRLSTIHTYLHSNDAKTRRLRARYRNMFQNFDGGKEEDGDVDIIYLALGFNVVGGLVHLSELAKRFEGIVARRWVIREFKRWCERNGLDPASFYRRGYKKTGYWVPWEFAEHLREEVRRIEESRRVLTPAVAEEVV